MKKRLMIAFLIVLLCGFAATANALNIFFDDFESDTTGLSKTSLNHWTVMNSTLGGSVDVIGVGTDWNFFPEFGQYVDLDGSTGTAGWLVSESISATAGSYILTFDLAGSQRMTTATDSVWISVTFGDLVETIVLSYDQPFTTFTREFQITSDMTTNIFLQFAGLGGDNVGLLLDNVSVDTAPVPEPATMLLLGTGLVGLAGASRKKIFKKK